MENITTTISKGIIKEIPGNGSNIFKVRMPLFEDCTNREMIFNATACVQPGLSGGYKVGDVVFVTFENEEAEMAIILGKLYTNDGGNSNAIVGSSDETTVVLTANTINVSNNATLPDSTSIGGVLMTSIKRVIQKVNYMFTKLIDSEGGL